MDASREEDSLHSCETSQESDDQAKISPPKNWFDLRNY